MTIPVGTYWLHCGFSWLSWAPALSTLQYGFLCSVHHRILQGTRFRNLTCFRPQVWVGDGSNLPCWARYKRLTTVIGEWEGRIQSFATLYIAYLVVFCFNSRWNIFRKSGSLIGCTTARPSIESCCIWRLGSFPPCDVQLIPRGFSTSVIPF
jgi:hypothetical protein